MKIYLIIIILFLSIHNFVNCTEKESEYKDSILIPNIKPICFNGACIDDQFKSSYSKNKKYYYAIVTKDTKLKSAPNEKDSKNGNLYISDEVIILYKEIFNNETWIFVKKYLDCELKDDNICYGWIPNNLIAYKSMFKPDLTWAGKKLEYPDGDINYYISFQSEGNYIGKWVSTYPSDKGKSGNMSGTVYRYNDILYLKNSALKESDRFSYLCDPKKDKSCLLKVTE